MIQGGQGGVTGNLLVLHRPCSYTGSSNTMALQTPPTPTPTLITDLMLFVNCNCTFRLPIQIFSSELSFVLFVAVLLVFPPWFVLSWYCNSSCIKTPRIVVSVQSWVRINLEVLQVRKFFFNCQMKDCLFSSKIQ